MAALIYHNVLGCLPDYAPKVSAGRHTTGIHDSRTEIQPLVALQKNPCGDLSWRTQIDGLKDSRNTRVCELKRCFCAMRSGNPAAQRSRLGNYSRNPASILAQPLDAGPANFMMCWGTTTPFKVFWRSICQGKDDATSEAGSVVPGAEVEPHSTDVESQTEAFA
jgi:hypothetical protein